MGKKSFFNSIESYEQIGSSDLMLVIMFIGGCVSLMLAGTAWGLWGIYDGWQLTKTGIKTMAEVTDLSSYSTKNGVRHNPIITFTSADNKKHQVTLTEGCPAQKGLKIEVIYHAGSPEGSVRVNSVQALFINPLILIIVTFAVATPFLIELRKMLIAGGLLADPRLNAPQPKYSRSNQPSIAALNRQIFNKSPTHTDPQQRKKSGN
ncbi:MAG TPA: hypothetical protein PKI71_16400 [Candidatus Rifleibacterium sp.]|nr:hypothetical protein [Candidatus Rifleibacterium sp.]